MSDIDHPAHYGGADDPYEAAWYLTREADRLAAAERDATGAQQAP